MKRGKTTAFKVFLSTPKNLQRATPRLSGRSAAFEAKTTTTEFLIIGDSRVINTGWLRAEIFLMVLSRLSLGLGLIRGYVVRVGLDLYVSSTFVYFHQSDTRTVIADISSYKLCLWPVPNQILSRGVSPCLVTHLHAQLRGPYLDVTYE